MALKNSKERKVAKRSIVLKNQEYSANRTPQQQLKSLDARFGTGLGAAKERAKLEKKIKEKSE